MTDMDSPYYVAHEFARSGLGSLGPWLAVASQAASVPKNVREVLEKILTGLLNIKNFDLSQLPDAISSMGLCKVQLEELLKKEQYFLVNGSEEELRVGGMTLRHGVDWAKNICDEVSRDPVKPKQNSAGMSK